MASRYKTRRNPLLITSVPNAQELRPRTHPRSQFRITIATSCVSEVLARYPPSRTMGAVIFLLFCACANDRPHLLLVGARLSARTSTSPSRAGHRRNWWASPVSCAPCRFCSPPLPIGGLALAWLVKTHCCASLPRASAPRYHQNDSVAWYATSLARPLSPRLFSVSRRHARLSPGPNGHERGCGGQPVVNEGSPGRPINGAVVVAEVALSLRCLSLGMNVPQFF